MANVTYLLGAGASCHCLPTYQNFALRFKAFKEFIDHCKSFPNIDHLSNDIDKISRSCKEIINEFEFHNTPDTIAKKYFHLRINGEEKLNQLKIILILYFCYEQCISIPNYHGFLARANPKHTATSEPGKSRIDKRYDSFIASILKPIYSEINIETNFNILTWNYDIQFELCFQNYCQKDLLTAQHAIQSMPSVKTIAPDFVFDHNKFSIVHLNGIAFSLISEYPSSPFGKSAAAEELINDIVKHYKILNSPGQNQFDGKELLNFAWERSESFPGNKTILETTRSVALNIARRTQILVIIGYSFPIFNRSVDNEIFKSMIDLKKIYIQSPNAESQKETLIEIFGSVNANVNKENIKSISSLDYFHIPAEWKEKLLSNRSVVRPQK